MKNHGIHFSDAEAVLFDPNAIFFEDEGTEGKQRHVAMDLNHLGHVLVVFIPIVAKTVG